MRRLTTLLLFLLGSISLLKANSEPSTYFNIYIPNESELVEQNVAIIVTAIYDNTTFSIIDDYEKGEEDKSCAGVLMAGQSHVLHLTNKSLKRPFNDNPLSTNKSKGDHFTITSNQLVYASKSTQNDWQFDYLPAQIKSSVGQRFIVFASAGSDIATDLNVFAYDDNTTVTVKAISSSNLTETNRNALDINQDSVILKRTLDKGEDLIQFYQDGRRLLTSGKRYLIEASNPVSVQYGVLQHDSENGGKYVPSNNGSLAGNVFYFSLSKQTEKQIRIISWKKHTKATVERFSNGAWQVIGNYNLGELESAEFTTIYNSTDEAETFRISTARTKKLSVFIDQSLTFAKGW